MDRLKKSLLYTYGVGDLFFALMVNMEAYFFTAFLTDYAQFSLTITGQILGITSLIDIVCALAGGVLLQKITLKYGGKYRSWFLVGPSIVVPLFILQFTKIGGDLTAASIVMFGFVASHLTFNVVVAASGAMVSRLSQLPDERTVLSVSRAQGMSAASLIFSATAMPMILFFSAHTNKIAGFTSTVAVYGFLMILGYLYVYRITAGKDPYDEAISDNSQKTSGQSIKEMVGLAFKNPPLMLLTLAQIFSSTGLFIITAMAIYYFTYVVGKPEFLSVFMVATSMARLVATFAASRIGVKLGKRRVYWIFVSLAAVGFASGRFLTDTPWGFTFMFCLATMCGSAICARVIPTMSSLPAAMAWRAVATSGMRAAWNTGNCVASLTSPAKSRYPGVSMKLKRRPCHSQLSGVP